MANLTAPMPSSATPFLKDGLINEPWYRFLFQLQLRGGGAGQQPDLNALQVQADYNTANVDYQSVVQQDPLAQAAIVGVDELRAAASPDVSAQLIRLSNRVDEIEARQPDAQNLTDIRGTIQEIQASLLELPSQSFGRPVVGAKFSTYSASVSANNGAATTIFTLPSQFPSVYLVSANIGAVADTANYSAFAVVLADGASTRLANVSNGALHTITLSGLNIQSTQGSGGTQTINMTITRIA